MFKLIVLARRRADISHDELVSRWRETRIPAVIANARPDRYRVTIFDPGDKVPYDGMDTLWFDDAERAEAWLASAALASEQGDGFSEFTDNRPVSLLCEERVIVDGTYAEGAVKLTGLINPKAGVDADTFYTSWREDHAPNVARSLRATSGGLRYVVSPVTLGGPDPDFAGVAETYYENAAAAQAHLKSLKPDDFLQYVEFAGFLTGREIVGVA